MRSTPSSDRSKVVKFVTPDRSEIMAVFTFSDDKVTAKYENKSFKESVESVGILSSDGTSKLMIGDGVKFFNALDTAWAASSFIHVEDKK